jgi:hypothetical protein
MGLRSGPWWCAPGACTLTHRAQRWRVVGSSGARGRWRRLRPEPARPRVLTGARRLERAVRSVGSGWGARPSSPGPERHPQSRQLGSRSPAGRRDRGRLEADLERRSLPCRGAAGASCETRRATLSSPATDRGPNRPRGRRRGPTEGAPPGWDPLPSSRALEAVAPHAVGGPSNPVLKRTAAGSRVPLSSGLAAASHLFVRPLQFRKFTL